MIEIERNAIMSFLKPGFVIWRPLAKDDVSAVHVEPSKTEGQSSAVAIQLGNDRQLCREPIVHFSNGPRMPAGIVCFLVDEHGSNIAELPVNWCYLRIYRQTRSGRALYAYPVEKDLKDYIDFRRELGYHFREPDATAGLSFAFNLWRLHIAPHESDYSKVRVAEI